MSAAPEPRWAEPQSTGWDPFSNDPLAPIAEERSAVEPVQLHVVREHPESAPAPTSAPRPEAPPSTPSAPAPTPAPAPAAAETAAPAPEVDEDPDEAAASVDETPASPVDRIRAWVQETWWMPNLLADRPASVIEVVAYAESGAQHAREDGPGRTFSKLWGYLVAAPVSVVLYLVAYLIQRPGRAATVGVVLFLAWLAWVTN